MNLEKEAEKVLIKVMEDNPKKAISWMLLTIGKELIKSHAVEMESSVHATIEGKRYKIKVVQTIEEVEDDDSENLKKEVIN